jgi:hypothetical protein
MDYKRFFVVLAITAALAVTATIAATSMTFGGSNKAFAALPPEASGHGQAGDHGGGTCPPLMSIPRCK